MYLILTASKDTYVTNKVIDNKFRATDANVGRAGTLDLFKLYNESTLSGDTNVWELSRLLVDFDLSGIDSIASSSLNLNSSTFQAKLKLFNLLGGQATPSNFKVVSYPLSQSFDEGIGRNVASFGDLDVANFITASYSNSTVYAWNVSGANAPGALNSANIDIITSGNLGDGVVDFGSTQTFSTGDEDLELDVSTVISGTLDGRIPDFGFRISFTGSQETDTKTRFVKRFASRHSSNPFKVPQLHISWDDSTIDNHEDFIFDVSGSLFFQNYHRGTPANILSGTSATALTGDSCITLKLEKQDWVKYYSGSQHKAGTVNTAKTGLYSASFAVALSDSTLVNKKDKLIDLMYKSGSVTFDEIWMSTDETVGFYTGSLEIKMPQRTAYEFDPKDLIFRFTNVATEYTSTDEVKFNVFVIDRLAEQKVYKTPFSLKSISLSKVYYRVRDPDTGTIIIPFKDNDSNSATRLSSNSSGMAFNFRMESLFPGRSYVFDLLIKDYDINRIYEGVSGKFRVV